MIGEHDLKRTLRTPEMRGVDDVVQMPDQGPASKRAGEGGEHEGLLRVRIDKVVPARRCSDLKRSCPRHDTFVDNRVVNTPQSITNSIGNLGNSVLVRTFDK